MTKIKYYKETHFQFHNYYEIWKAEFIGSSGNELYKHYLRHDNEWLDVSGIGSRFYDWYSKTICGLKCDGNDTFIEITEKEVFVELL